MSHTAIPAPLRSEAVEGLFELRSGTRVAYSASEVAPVVERFCSEISRRTGLELAPLAGQVRSNQPAVLIELGSGDEELGRLPEPLGVSPAGDDPPDERHALAIGPDRVVVRAVQPVGIARGLTTLVQLLAAGRGGAPEISVPCGKILDAPRYAWRGLSLDLVRASFTLEEVHRIIDLLALYKLNALHLHLTDDQGWRLPVGRSGHRAEADDSFYAADGLRALVGYAGDRFVTLVPEVDTPGHAAAFVGLRPELKSGRNEVEVEFPPGHPHKAVWLDPELPATFALVEEVLAGVADLFPSPYIHIGGDEPLGMPHHLYASYVPRVRELVRSIGKRPLGWQESARAGLGAEDIIQYWFTDIALPASLPSEIRAQMDADLAKSHHDVEAAVAASVPVIVSPLSNCYLDVPYAEPSADPRQAERQKRVGLRLYSPITVAESFEWEPSESLGGGRASLVAGVEAAIWAETISDFDDLAFLLLPRLPGIAHKAWSDPHTGSWTDHRDRLSRHGHLWEQDNLTYFRTSTVDWR